MGDEFMPMFRKKPVVIEAFQNVTGMAATITEWMGRENEGNLFSFDERSNFRIVTLEGEMIAGKGDWIIKGVKGEFYPCKPDIFEATYEPYSHATLPTNAAPANIAGMTQRKQLESMLDASGIGYGLMDYGQSKWLVQIETGDDEEGWYHTSFVFDGLGKLDEVFVIPIKTEGG
jgi:hypothetical protein